MYELDFDFIWKRNSHFSGKDIEIVYPYKEKLSIKSGSLTKKHLTISSSRTTKYKTIEDKISFYKNVEIGFDTYFIVAKQKNTNAGKSYITYVIYTIPKNVLSIDNVCFEKNNSGWISKNNSDYTFSIVKSMSDQIWIKTSLSYIKQYITNVVKFIVIENDNGLAIYKKL